MTSQHVCEGSTGKRSPQGLEKGLRAPQRRVERKKGGTKAWRQRLYYLRARLEDLEQKEGEGAQGGQGLPSRRESGTEEQWRMDTDFEDEVESRKKLDEQKRKLQKEL